MKSSILFGLLSIVELSLCVSLGGVPSGNTFLVRFAAVTNGVYYLGYRPGSSSFSAVNTFGSAVRITQDSATNFLYARTPTILDVTVESGFVVLTFDGAETGIPVDFSRANAVASDSSQGQGQDPSEQPLYCILGQIVTRFDGDEAPLTCNVPGFSYDNFGFCKVNNILYAYDSDRTDLADLCPDGDGSGQITSITAVSILYPAPPVPSDSSTSDIEVSAPPSSSTSTSTTENAVPTVPASTSNADNPAPTSSISTSITENTVPTSLASTLNTNIPASTSPTSVSNRLPSSTVEGSCPVTFQLNIFTTTLYLSQGTSIPSSSTDAALASTLSSLSVNYGCVQFQTISI